MKRTNIFTWVLVMFLLVVVVSGQPPFEDQTQYLDGVLKVETLEINTHPLNNPFYLHTHIYSTADGLITDPIADNVSCDYHLYSENINWEHLDIGNLTSYGVGMYNNINESYFNETGNYAILLWCECDGCVNDRPDDVVGGYTRFSFEVVDYEDNTELSLGWSFLIMSILVIMILIGIGIQQPIISILGALGLLFYSFTLYTVSVPIAFIITLISLMIFIWEGVKGYGE